jgi:tRNA U54 and U55 pseudouridine synthase Pus10
MKKLVLAMIVFGLLGITAAESFGQITPGADRREYRQKQRIKQGVKSGELTGRETVKIMKQRQNIKNYEAQIKSDGQVTWQERARLQNKLNKSSRNIYKAKHNSRNR